MGDGYIQQDSHATAEMQESLQAPVCLHRGALVQHRHLLDIGGDFKPPDARRWELAGIQVGNMLHGLVNSVNVIPLYAQRRLTWIHVDLKQEKGVRGHSSSSMSW